MANIWDIVNSIHFNKSDLLADGIVSDNDYIPFIINKSLSYFPDTIMYANEMNRYAFLPKKQQYDFLRISITKKKRFSKWSKKEKIDKINLLQKYYSCSEKKAVEIARLLNDAQIDFITQSMKTGGLSK